MKKTIFIIIILFTISSCRFSGTIDENTMKPIQSKIDKNNIIGKWHIDNFSYMLIKKKGKYEKDSLQLNFNNDNTFKMKNVPDFFSNFSGNKYKLILSNESGIWELKKNGTNEELIMTFKKSDLFPSGYTTNFSIFKKENKFNLIYFVGDPDNNERFLFIKK